MPRVRVRVRRPPAPPPRKLRRWRGGSVDCRSEAWPDLSRHARCNRFWQQDLEPEPTSTSPLIWKPQEGKRCPPRPRARRLAPPDPCTLSGGRPGRGTSVRPLRWDSPPKRKSPRLREATALVGTRWSSALMPRRSARAPLPSPDPGGRARARACGRVMGLGVSGCRRAALTPAGRIGATIRPASSGDHTSRSPLLSRTHHAPRGPRGGPAGIALPALPSKRFPRCRDQRASMHACPAWL